MIERVNRERYDEIIRTQGTPEGDKLWDSLSEEEQFEISSKAQVGRERCWECGKWSGGFISDWDDGNLRQVCPDCAPKFPGRNVMFMYDIKKLHEEHPDVISWDPNFSLNKGEKYDY